MRPNSYDHDFNQDKQVEKVGVHDSMLLLLLLRQPHGLLTKVRVIICSCKAQQRGRNMDA